MINEMYNLFPRQVAIPKRCDINTMDELMKFVEKWNGKVRIFVSVYNYTAKEEEDLKNLKVNKLFFDLDSQKGYENTIKFHFWLMEKNYKHVILFSGNGFHVYVFSKNFEKLKNKKDALYNAQHHIAKEVGLTIGDPKIADIDEHIIGDIARVATMVGTWNIKRERFCVCLTESLLLTSYEIIKEYAKTQNLGFKFYGKELLDISQFDTIRPNHIEAFHSNPEVKIKIDKDDFLKKLPPCIANMLCLKHLGYKKRGYVICYLRDSGYLLNETIQILRTYLSTSEYLHCCTRGMAPGHTTFGEMQPQYFYKSYVRDKISFPGCRKLKMYGECPYQEDYFCDEGKKLYKR